MYGYIYLTTNLINNKKYVGLHQSKKFDPDYKGSGKLLKRAFNKYGFENFDVKILEECDDFESLLNAEEKWISDLNCVSSDEYYNLRDGGHGGWKSGGVSIKKGVRISEQARINTRNSHLGKKMPESFKEIKRNYWKSDANPAKHYTELDIKKMSDYRKGKIWVTNDQYDKNIKPDELDDYISRGFRRGRCTAHGKVK